MSPAPQLVVSGLSVAVDGTCLLDDVSFTVEPGERVAVTGSSGAGKSTLLHAVAGVSIGTTSGGVTIAGRARVVGAPGFVPQDTSGALDPLWRIDAQLQEVLEVHEKLDKGTTRERCRTLLGLVGLDDSVLRAWPHQLSGGNKQRICIAMAIAHSPDVLLFDEPTTSLDAISRTAVIDLIDRICERTGASLLLSTHDPDVVRRLAARRIHLDAGRIVDPPTVVTARPIVRHAGKPGPVVAVVHDVSLRFDEEPAVDRVSLQFYEGETVAIVGESGCGKTTLARMLLGLIEPDEGDISIFGHHLARLTGRQSRQLRKRMQLVLQDPYASLDERLTVHDIVAEPLRALGSWTASSDRVVAGVLGSCGLDETFLHRRPRQLSGGQRQRVSLARAMVLRPELLVLDEPTSSLDHETRNDVLDTIEQLARETSMTTVFISHDLATVRSIADRVVVMQSGRVVEIAGTEALFSTPAHPYSAALVAAG